jgi:hypothetical protein
MAEVIYLIREDFVCLAKLVIPSARFQNGQNSGVYFLEFLLRSRSLVSGILVCNMLAAVRGGTGGGAYPDAISEILFGTPF